MPNVRVTIVVDVEVSPAGEGFDVDALVSELQASGPVVLQATVGESWRMFRKAQALGSSAQYHVAHSAATIEATSRC